MKQKRIAALLLAMTMVAASLAGCGSTPSAESSAAGTESKAPEKSSEEAPAEVPEEPVTINVTGYTISGTFAEENSWAEQLLEEELGNVDINLMTDINADNIKLELSSGSTDITSVCWQLIFNTYPELIDQGLLRSFPGEWLYEYMPVTMANLEACYSDVYGVPLTEEMMTVNGEYYCIPHAVTNNTSTLMSLYRKDWADKLGIAEPTSLEELHDMMYAFTYDDPDGNGKDDTYGSAPIWGNTAPYYCFGAFGIEAKSNYSVDENGKVYYSGVQEGWREGLKLVKEWYDEGIFAPDMMGWDRNQQREAWQNGTFGVLSDYTGWCNESRGTSAIQMLPGLVNPNAEIGYIGELTTEYGDGHVWVGNYYFDPKGCNMSMFFAAGATDEQVIGVMRMMEAVAATDEMYMKICYGEEGKDYTIENGSIVVNPDVTDADRHVRGVGGSFFGGTASPAVTEKLLTPNDLAMLAKCNSGNYMRFRNNAAFITPVNTAATTYGAEVSKIESEYYANVLLGLANLEGDWDAYVKNMEAAGLNDIIAEYQAALDK